MTQAPTLKPMTPKQRVLQRYPKAELFRESRLHSAVIFTNAFVKGKVPVVAGYGNNGRQAWHRAAENLK